VWSSSVVSGVTFTAFFKIICEVAVDSDLIQVLQGHMGGGMKCGAKTVISLFTFVIPSNCAESTYRYVTKTSKCFLMLVLTNIHLTFIVHNVFYCCIMCI
jgi:hypothetical protein